MNFIKIDNIKITPEYSSVRDNPSAIVDISIHVPYDVIKDNKIEEYLFEQLLNKYNITMEEFEDAFVEKLL